MSLDATTRDEATGGPYRASLVKRRRPRKREETRSSPAREGEAGQAPDPAPARDLQAEQRRVHRQRVNAEREAIRRVDAITRSWNEELASTVPSLGAVVSRAVAQIVGEAPREEVVVTALRRELGRVRGEHAPVLRVSTREDAPWIARLREEGRAGRTTFSVRGDEGLEPGKCVLELGARRVDLTPETQLAAFDDRLRSAAGAVPPRAAPAMPRVAPLPEIAEPEIAVAATDDGEPAPARERPEAAGPAKPRHRVPAGTSREGEASPAGEAAPAGTITTDATVTPAQAGAPAPERERKASETAATGASPRPVKRFRTKDDAPAAGTPAGTAPVRRSVRTKASRGSAGDATPSTPEGSARREAPKASARTSAPKVSAKARPESMQDRAGRAGEKARADASGETKRTAPQAPADASAKAGRAKPGKRRAADELSDFDALDLGADAARFEGRAPVAADGTTGAARGADARGSDAVAALRDRVARTASALREDAGLKAREAPTTTPTTTPAPADPTTPVERLRPVEAAADGLPPFVFSGDAYRGVRAPTAPEEATDGAPSPSVPAPAGVDAPPIDVATRADAPARPANEPADKPGDRIRRAIARPADAVTKADIVMGRAPATEAPGPDGADGSTLKGTAADADTPRGTDARGGTDGRGERTAKGSLRLPPRIAKLIAESRGE